MYSGSPLEEENNKATTQYLHRIKNETDRIKRRQQRSHDVQSLPVNQREDSRTANSTRHAHTPSQPPPQCSSPHQAPNRSPKNNLPSDDDDEEEEYSEVELVPLDSRGESFSALDNKSTNLGKEFVDPVPKRNMSNYLLAEHEAFRRKLVDDVLGDGASDRVPMEKVVMLIWQYRDDPQVVRFMTRFVAKVRLYYSFQSKNIFCFRNPLLLVSGETN